MGGNQRNLLLLFGSHSSLGKPKLPAPTGLYFHKNEATYLLRNEVYLSELGAVVAFVDLMTAVTGDNQ